VADRAVTCTRCGRGPLVYDKRVGLYRLDGVDGLEHTYCWGDGSRFPSWKHTPAPLTVRQINALERARKEGAPI
jgi:hypothetical protein